jgi:hypothetical protein
VYEIPSPAGIISDKSLTSGHLSVIVSTLSICTSATTVLKSGLGVLNILVFVSFTSSCIT